MRSRGQKLKILYLKDMLERNTDEEHGMTASQIIEELRLQGINAERKSVYDDLAALEAYGLEIEAGGKGVGYRLLERDFDLAEISLLTDMVQSSKYLSEEKTEVLTKKLHGLCSKHEAQSIRGNVYVTNRTKSEDQRIHYNLLNLHRAIEIDRKVEFKVYFYTQKKERSERRYGKMYSVSPYAVISSDNEYYLLGFDDEYQSFQHYRVNRLTNLEITGEERAGKEEFQRINMSDYTKYTFAMNGLRHGLITPVTMRFSNRVADAVLERFGLDVVMEPEGHRFFRITVPISVCPQFFAWVFSFGPCAEILEPESVRNRMIKALQKSNERYTGSSYIADTEWRVKHRHRRL